MTEPSNNPRTAKELVETLRQAGVPVSGWDEVNKEIGDGIVKSGSEAELKRKRMIAQRSAQIIVASLENDVKTLIQRMEEPGIPLQTKLMLADTAKCILTTISWIMGPQGQPESNGHAG